MKDRKGMKVDEGRSGSREDKGQDKQEMRRGWKRCLIKEAMH